MRKFTTKAAGAQEAHEAIRPTDMALEKGSNEYDQKLYNLIRSRALASQMAPAQLSEKTTITIAISTGKVFEAKGEVIIFDGFLKVYGTNKKKMPSWPAVASGDTLKLSEATARQTFTCPPARYTEGARKEASKTLVSAGHQPMRRSSTPSKPVAMWSRVKAGRRTRSHRTIAEAG